MSNLALKRRNYRVTQMMNDAVDCLSIPRADIGPQVFAFLPVHLAQHDTGDLGRSDRQDFVLPETDRKSSSLVAIGIPDLFRQITYS